MGTPQDQQMVGDATLPVQRRRKPKKPKGTWKRSALPTVPIPSQPSDAAVHWGKRLSDARRDMTGGIVEFGRLLNQAKEELLAHHGHGEWLNALAIAGIDEDAAGQYMRIARHPVVGNSDNFRNLPDARSSLYHLARLQPEMVTELIASGVVHPGVTTKTLKEALEPSKPKKVPPRWTQATPFLMDAVKDFYGGTIDTLANREDHLGQVWTGRVFVNPPGDARWIERTAGQWVFRAKTDFREGMVSEVLLFLPGAKWTNWFHVAVVERCDINALFPLGKLAGTDTILLYLGHRHDEFATAFRQVGECIVRRADR